MKKLLFGMAMLVLSWSVYAAEYYVDADSRGGPADDAGPGTKEKPWKTLGRAGRPMAPTVGSGDVVWVRGGVYKETLIVHSWGYMGQDTPICVKAYSGEKVIIDGEGVHGFGLILHDANYVHIEGLVFQNFAQGGSAVCVYGGEGVTLKKVNVSGAMFGIDVRNATHFSLLESEVHDCWENIYVTGPSSDILIADNHIHHSRKGDCIHLYGFDYLMVKKGKLAAVEQAGPGLAAFTVADTNLVLNRGFKWNMKLIGQDKGGTVQNPAAILLFLSGEDPQPDGVEIKGGTFPLPDGRQWFVLHNNSDWNDKPYSPDGKQGLFEAGSAKMEELKRAKYLYIAQAVAPPNMVRDVQILRNEIHDSDRQGILAPGTDGLLIQGNKIYHNGASGIQIETGTRNIWIDGNTSLANNHEHSGETGMWIDEVANGVVQNNVISENNRGLMVSHAQWIITRRNVIYRNNNQHVAADQLESARRSSCGFAFRGCRHAMLGAPRCSEHNAFVHNTVYGNGDEKSVWMTIVSGIPTYPKVGVNVMMNNLVQKNLCDVTLNVWYSEAPILDGNIYYARSPVKVRWKVDKDVMYVISEAQGMEDYRKATGQDMHSLVQEAAFVNPDTGDFHLAKGSVAVDKGQPLAKTVLAGEGTSVPVTDVRCFSAGFKTSKGQQLIPGDEIMVAGKPARIESVDREKKILVVDKSLKWQSGDPVSYGYAGSAPDVGAFEWEPE